ncbi:HlyD family secretion protein [Aquabacter spiritensis]|uniref:Multidrug efflux system membrane fusion protein n=1 Tax=Aquabacter spiritensis TaxID=933073 RepID=A0A4R3LS52_9HYPH|nr:HlyD family secretion protein [Aquabacter spiritensis]TCT02616.1 multidrug efflux system membrane fusion protein [Aquabacter spiritensis]
MLGAFVALILLYFGVTWFVSYTEDAYVRSDFVAIAPEVAGVVQQVDVLNDQAVKVGDRLATIDPTPFALDVTLKTREVENARARVRVAQEGAAEFADEIDNAQAGLTLIEREYQRILDLYQSQDVSQVTMDELTDKRQQALDALSAARTKAQVNAAEVATAVTQVEIAQAELAIATYALSRTTLTAPVAGYITNLSLRPGAYASVGVPLLGMVDESQWRIVANFKEYVAARLTPGMRAWVWLDSHPGRFYPARITGVGRGISRVQGSDGLLPYVAPTTDWIRLARRLPVTMVLDPRPPDLRLFMGADARVLVFP